MNKFVILALIFLGVQLISAQTLNKDVDCKCKLPSSRRIVGGEYVKFSIPWQVSLQDLGNHFCGGTVINRNWIMSAAHCTIITQLNPDRMRDIRVRVGITTLDTAQTAKNTFKVKRIIHHPRYNLNNASTVGDISLIELDGTLEFTETLQPACLPQTAEQYTGNKALEAVGWGSIKTLIKKPLEGVSPPVFPNKLKHAYFDYDEQLYPECKLNNYLVCLKTDKTPDSICAGDSGSGLIHVKNGISRVVGIAQFVLGKRNDSIVEICYGPSAYQRVSYVKPFIQKVIGNDFCSKN